MSLSLTFDAVAEASPGAKWRARWRRSWPAYRAWFLRGGGRAGPDRATCEAALAAHMPELVTVHARLVEIAGGDDLAARFLAAWCPPPYLGGCSVAAVARHGETRLIRNYDLSPDLNEGLLLRSAWTGGPVMGMSEFLWGLSDGVNAAGLAVALAFGGGRETAPGFGICLILRYVLETCATVAEALAALERIPSHMDYNLVLADAAGASASVEMRAGGGATPRRPAIATNHQLRGPLPEGAAFTRTVERRAALEAVVASGEAVDGIIARFQRPPLLQTDYAGGAGTLFTASYDPARGGLTLIWPQTRMRQTIARFTERSLAIRYDEAPPAALDAALSAVPPRRRAEARRWLAAASLGAPDWTAFGDLFRPFAVEREGEPGARAAAPYGPIEGASPPVIGYAACQGETPPA